MNLTARTQRASRNATRTAVVAVAAALAAVTLSACDTDDDCDRAPVVMFWSVADHTYHYGSPTGNKVPTSKVPPAARKVPGYKPYTPPKTSLNKPGAGSGYKPNKPVSGGSVKSGGGTRSGRR